ncbi:succinate receptor 1 [Trachemys scripta elegans]|uniref:succinate receptor 1 n=1 Tax=Trachemys scripta elegans TaxID=31138 RepID=UPI00155404D2|nr:succinate receptor 1 [Trachemys scripta elegans]
MDENKTGDCLEMDNTLQKYYLSTMYTIEFIFGIIGNSIVVFGYIFCLKVWKSGNIYLFNLSLSDFVFLCTLPMLVTSYSKGKWTYGNILCQSNRFMLHVNLYTSILFLTFISIDRYMLMQYPFRDHFLQKRKIAVVFSVAIWILVILELLPIITFIGSRNTANDNQCTDYASSGDPAKNLIYSICLTLLGFVIPLCVMCFFYVKMVLFLKKRSEQLTAAQALEKPLTLVIMALVIFSLFFTPYHIMRNVRIASRMESWKLSLCTRNIINTIYIITRPIAFLNSVINPIFYFLMGDHFREMLMTKVRQLLKRFTPTANEVTTKYSDTGTH